MKFKMTASQWNKFALAGAIALSTSFSAQALQVNPQWGLGKIEKKRDYWKPSRCTNFEPTYPDGLTVEQGAPRATWALKCVEKEIQKLNPAKSPTRWRGLTTISTLIDVAASATRVEGVQGPFYPVFGIVDPVNFSNSNPKGYSAPILVEAECDIPKEYTVVGVCGSGCYTGEQNVLFSEGYLPIGDAYGTKKSIVTLDASSTLEAPMYRTHAVNYFMRDIAPVKHSLVRIQTRFGRELRVTENHPVLLADGKMVQAKTLDTNSVLMAQDGTIDPVLNLRSEEFTGYTYNVDVDAENPIENVVVAQGLLNGGAFFQNTGKTLLDRSLFRVGLPDSAVTQ